MHTIPVRTKGGLYCVQVGRDFGPMLEELLRTEGAKRRVSRVIAIVDTYLASRVADALPLHTTVIETGGSESAKTRDSKSIIEDQLLDMECDKDTVLVAIGGGSIGDMVGFVAATYLRGIRVIQVPTTLLSMVDASVGGKTAVNCSIAKNMIGAFHQPIGVVIDTTFLHSLDDRHFSNGIAEIVKAGLVGDIELWRLLHAVPSVTFLRSADATATLTNIIVKAIEYKRRVVEADERDSGIRNELNCGHTIGHALEMLDDSQLWHGECVAIGMVYELMCLRAIGHLDNAGDIPALISMLGKFNLPTEVPPTLITPSNEGRVRQLLMMDKKANLVATGDTVLIPIVAVKTIGEAIGPTRTVGVPMNTVMRVLSPFVSVMPPLKPVCGSVCLPGSKSVANRALLLAVIAARPCRLTNVPASVDVQLMFTALQQLGYCLEMNGSVVDVRPAVAVKVEPDTTVFVGNSGTTARFLLPLAALLVCGRGSGIDSIAFTCDPRMAERPIQDLLTCLLVAFPTLKVNHQNKPGHFPLTLSRGGRGKRAPISSVTIDGGMSSQFVSGLLMMAPLYPRPLAITVTGLKDNGEAVSQPFIDMTVKMINMFGGMIVKVTNGLYECQSSGYSMGGLLEYAIPGDAAAASYPLAIAAITGGTVTVNVTDDGLQRDFLFVKFLQQIGCCVEYGATLTTVTGPARLTVPPGTQFDMSEMTDTFLTASVLLAVAGDGVITSIANQRVKECDRIAAMALNLSRCGYRVDEQPDGLTVTGVAFFIPKPSPVETFNDHRVAMAMAVLGCVHSGILIENPRCAEKTFPDFWDVVERSLGVTIAGSPWVDTRVGNVSVLVGMRGIGKSTIGRFGAFMALRQFVDLDEYIASIHKMSVADIIETHGWAQFRDMELAALRRAIAGAARSGLKTVLATGGGIVESEAARGVLKRIKQVIWMRTLIDEVTIRAAEEASRAAPAYADTTVSEVYMRRKPWYEEVSTRDIFVRRGRCGSVAQASGPLAQLLFHTAAARVPSKLGSVFVCLTASSYAGWTQNDFASAIGAHESVDAVEIRIDKLDDIDEFVEGFMDIRDLLGETPVILTLRTVNEGGCFGGEYMSCFTRLVRLAPDWIDVEISQPAAVEWVRDNCRSSSWTNFIASRHYACVPPMNESELNAAIAAVMSPVWAQVGKIVYHAETHSDCARLSAAAASGRRSSPKPLIAVCTGPAGLYSRVANPVWTPVCSPDRLRMGPAAPGQIDAAQLAMARSGSLGQSSWRFHLFGSPIHMSPSPFIHNLMFALKGLSSGECLYSATHAMELADILPLIHSPLFRGASITTPLKETVFQYLVNEGCSVDRDAILAGAVNTLSLKPNGRLVGNNTDILALRFVLHENRRARCLVVGTGGAARGAAIAAVRMCGGPVYVYGRDSEKVTDLCMHIRGAIPFTAGKDVDVVIGCVPSEGQADFIQAFPNVITSRCRVIEMAYVPRDTPLILDARLKGVPDSQIVYGSEILLLQGVEQHKIWMAALSKRAEVPKTPLIDAPTNVELVWSQLRNFRPPSSH